MSNQPKDGIYTNGIKLTRAQRRQVRKNADQIDRTTVETDRRFFKRFPHRRFRMRLPGQAELAQSDIVQGEKPAPPPPGFRYFVIVRLVAPGARFKLLVSVRIGCGLDDLDLPESELAEIWEAASSPQSRKAEEVMRQIGEQP